MSREYAELIRLAESAQGEMNLSILHDACTGYHRWHSIVIEDTKRGKAILQWVSQKIWEMPSGKEKSALVARFFDDLSRLIDSGRLSAEPTLELARKTVAWRDIRPQALGSEYFRLIKRYATAEDSKLRQYVYRECLSFPPVCYESDEEGDRVFEYLRQNYQDKKVPPNAAEHCRLRLEMQAGIDDSIERSEYEAIPLLQPTRWDLEGGENTDVPMTLGTMKYLLGWMLDRYDSAPDAVNRTLEKWIRNDGGPFEYEILGSSFADRSIYGSANNKSHPLGFPEGVVDTFVNGLVEQNARKDLDSHSATSIHSQMNHLMEGLAERDGGACSAKTVQRQKLILESQLNSVLEWERGIQKKARETVDYENSNSYRAYEIHLRVDFPKNQSLYCLEAKQFLKNKAQELLKSKDTYGDLSELAQARIEKTLRDVLAMP